MTPERVQAWLDAYVAAWDTYDEAAIRALFADGASYAYHPYDEPLIGPDAIAASWLGDRDEPGTWTASYAPALIDGDRAIAKGETRYPTRAPSSRTSSSSTSTPTGAARASSSGSSSTRARGTATAPGREGERAGARVRTR